VDTSEVPSPRFGRCLPSRRRRRASSGTENVSHTTCLSCAHPRSCSAAGDGSCVHEVRWTCERMWLNAIWRYPIFCRCHRGSGQAPGRVAAPPLGPTANVSGSVAPGRDAVGRHRRAVPASCWTSTARSLSRYRRSKSAYHRPTQGVWTLPSRARRTNPRHGQRAVAVPANANGVRRAGCRLDPARCRAAPGRRGAAPLAGRRREYSHPARGWLGRSVSCVRVAWACRVPFVHRHDRPIRSGGVVGDRQRIRKRVLD